MDKYAMGQRIDRILENARDALADLGDKYRREVLLPLCIEHRLTYVQGMGTYFFTTADGMNISGPEEARDEGLDVLVPVYEILDRECLHGNDWFGLYIADITEADRRKATEAFRTRGKKTSRGPVTSR